MDNAGGWVAGTITEAFELIADGQPIEACYIGQIPDRGWLPVAPTPPRTGLLDWDEAAIYLTWDDWDYTNPPTVIAWTADKVLYLHDYDCHITAESLPRNPRDCL